MYQPTQSGKLSSQFLLEYSSKHVFRSKVNCNNWIRDHDDTIDLDNVTVSSIVMVSDPIFID